MASATIPIIDFNKISDQLPQVIKACEEWGCFRIINPPVSFQLLTEMKSVARSLLDLPPEIKERNTDVIEGSGYVAPCPKNPLYEALGLYYAHSPEDVEKFCSEVGATPEQKEIIHPYAKKMYELAIYMGEKIAEGLGVKSASFEKWQSQFRMVKYSFKEGTPGGLQTHTDSGFITILQDDDTVAGFEALDGYGNFITIDPLPGSLVVNIGDMVQVWSNDRFKTMKHRVVCKETAVRISIVLLFLAPQNGVVMEAPEELIDADHPRRYKPITFEENRKLRLATSKREGQVLELFRID